MGKIRKSRYTTEPLPGRERPIKRLTATHIDILKLLEPRARYKYLPTHWITALLKKSAKNAENRLGRMFEKPNEYVGRITDKNYAARHMVYFLTDKGKQALIERGVLVDLVPLKPNHYAHDLVVYMTLASIELGQEHGYHYIPWVELQDHPEVPKETRHAKNPHIIKTSSSTVHADGYPFIIQLPHKTFHFPGLEVQMGTEGTEVSDASRPAFNNKFKHWKTFMDEKVYRTHYGFENCLVPFVFVKETDMMAAIRYVEKAYGRCAWMLFKTVPNFSKLERFEKPSAFFYETPWLRAGYSPEYLKNI